MQWCRKEGEGVGHPGCHSVRGDKMTPALPAVEWPRAPAVHMGATCAASVWAAALARCPYGHPHGLPLARRPYGLRMCGIPYGVRTHGMLHMHSLYGLCCPECQRGFLRHSSHGLLVSKAFWACLLKRKYTTMVHRCCWPVVRDVGSYSPYLYTYL